MACGCCVCKIIFHSSLVWMTSRYICGIFPLIVWIYMTRREKRKFNRGNKECTNLKIPLYFHLESIRCPKNNIYQAIK